MNIKEALEAVVKESNNPYAKTYAKAGLELGGSEGGSVSTSGNIITVTPEKTGNMMVCEELRVQLLYIISNLSHWRGERAKEVKTVLRAAAKNLNFERWSNEDI